MQTIHTKIGGSHHLSIKLVSSNSIKDRFSPLEVYQIFQSPVHQKLYPSRKISILYL